jgi:hypothetical protein
MTASSSDGDPPETTGAENPPQLASLVRRPTRHFSVSRPMLPAWIAVSDGL